jgi:hypothetical protein
MKIRLLLSLATVLMLAGGLLMATGLFAMSDITPLASMDCGCGGQTQCITKLAFLDRGAVLALSGGLMGLGTLLFSGLGIVYLPGRVRARASVDKG